MKIAVSGANGFVGRRVLQWIERAGHVAVPLVRKSSGLPAEVVVGDLGVSALPDTALAGADAVIHLAARTHIVRDAAVDPVAVYRHSNVASTAHLLDAAFAAGVTRFVYISSIKASGEWTLPGAPFTADTPPRPEDAYGTSKLEAEELVRTRCAEADVTWTILRPPLVHGAGAKGNLDLLIRAVASGIPLPFAGLNNRRSMVHVDNLADAIGRAATMEAAAGQILLVSDMTLSTPELTRAIATALGRRARLVPVPGWAARIIGRLTGRQTQIDRLWGSLEIDPAHASTVLGWHPPTDPTTALSDTVDAWRDMRRRSGFGKFDVDARRAG
jgi:nucleoside-diphosphate-sugar epimerase